MKTKKNNIIIILVILALLALFAIAFVLIRNKEQEGTAKPQVNDTEQILVIEDGTNEEVSDIREGVFKKGNSEKPKHTNADVKGGSETLEIIKSEEEKSSEEDAKQNREDSMLPGIW